MTLAPKVQLIGIGPFRQAQVLTTIMERPIYHRIHLSASQILGYTRFVWWDSNSVEEAQQFVKTGYVLVRATKSNVYFPFDTKIASVLCMMTEVLMEL